MKTLKSLIIIALILLFQFKLTGQDEINFDTINFKILTNLKENQTFKIRVIFDLNTNEGRFEFKKKNAQLIFSFFSDINYDNLGDTLIEGMKDSLIGYKILNSEDILFYEKAIDNCILSSQKGAPCSPHSYLEFYLNEKFLKQIIFCNTSELFYKIKR